MCEKKVPVLNFITKNRDTRFLKSYTLNLQIQKAMKNYMKW